MCAKVTSTSHLMQRDAEGRAECQRYLASFRVLELKELLKSIGCSQKGRKPDLFHRANELLRHGSPKIQNKIRDIYDRTNQSKRTLSYSRMARYSPMKSALSPSRGYIVHPDVKFKQHPFYQKVESVIRPTALVSTALTSSGSLSMRLQFHLTPQQVQQIYISKEDSSNRQQSFWCPLPINQADSAKKQTVHEGQRRRTAQGSYTTQVLVRFCRQETSCEQDDFFPKQCYLKVNDQYCPLPGYYPQLSSRPDYKRSGSPVNITNYVKTSATQANDVVVYWGHDIHYPQGFCVCIDIVNSVTASYLLQNLKAKGVRSPDVSRALVREKLRVEKDSEISATRLRVSLLCPLGKMRMKQPCRSTLCTHLQCFDANIYLQMNEKKARWVCPVCDKPAPLSDLVVDGLFMEICEQSPSNDIEFSCDGSWHPISSKEDKTAPSCLTVGTPDRRLTPVTVSDSPTSNKGGGNGGSEPVVIDLTLSSSEDEDDGEEEEEEEEEEEREVVPPRQPPPRRRSSRRSSSGHSTTAETHQSPRYSHSERRRPSDSGSREGTSLSRPVSVITQSRPHHNPFLAPSQFTHSELHTGVPSLSVEDPPLFSSLLFEDLFGGMTPPRMPSPANSGTGIISLD